MFNAPLFYRLQICLTKFFKYRNYKLPVIIKSPVTGPSTCKQQQQKNIQASLGYKPPPKGLFTRRWGTPCRWVNPLRWGNPPVHIISHMVTCYRSWKSDQVKMRDYMDRQVTPRKRFTAPTWGPPRPCKQALAVFQMYGNDLIYYDLLKL